MDNEDKNLSGVELESPLNALGHVLLTPETCNLDHDEHQCPICDGGLAVCANCGQFEAGLEGECVE